MLYHPLGSTVIDISIHAHRNLNNQDTETPHSI
jgi:hypothetical protein